MRQAPAAAPAPPPVDAPAEAPAQGQGQAPRRAVCCQTCSKVRVRGPRVGGDRAGDTVTAATCGLLACGQESEADSAQPFGIIRLAPPRLIAINQHCLHNACMATSITIRDVPDETRDELAARAALTGRSLQEYLRSRLIELARQPDAETTVARIRARKAATRSCLPAERILSHRDAERR